MPASQSLSVMIVDEEPDVLAFFARVLDANGIRALLARTSNEAVEIAKRGYVPIDIIVTDVALRASDDPASDSFDSGRDLVAAIRQLRPDVRSLFMSAYIDSGVIRIKMIDREFNTNSANPNDTGLIETIRKAATAALVHYA
jgi:CheY-like chemotaxis protein